MPEAKLGVLERDSKRIMHFKRSNAIGCRCESARYKVAVASEDFLKHLSWIETKPQLPGRHYLLESAKSDPMK